MLMAGLGQAAEAQVDTAYLYHSNTKFGTLDIRLSRGSGHEYYLEENKTFSFRQDENGPTNRYRDMTAWDSSPYQEGNLRERNQDSDLFVMNYRLLVPQQYDESFREGYPIVIVMHGMLERGNCAGNECYHADPSFLPRENDPPAPASVDHMLLNNDYSLVHAGLDYLEAHNLNGSRLPDDPASPAGAYPGFVLFPQNLNGWDPSAAHDVIRLIRLISKKYNIDENRIYINGISHGGHGAYEVIKRAPWMFAAAVMFSAADDAAVIRQKMTHDISMIPMWIFQGGLDANPTQAKTENYIKAFRKAGTNVRYTLYPHLGHGTWNKAMDEPDYFSWLLRQRRNNIHVAGGNASICATSVQGTVLTLPAGFQSYAWEYNGTLIYASETNTFTADKAGVYRAKFLRYDGDAGSWSNWSDELVLKEQIPDAVKLEQIGTLLLPDLNGNPDAQLRAAGDFPYYYWYKDGKPLSASLASDSLARITLTPSMGSGAYTVKVSGYDRCKSAESAPKHIVFDDQAPRILPSPFGFKAEAISPSKINLEWSDTSQNETGFEVWRAMNTVQTAPALWEMVTLTEKDVTSFTDENVSPSHSYYYKIRAVNVSARSDYAPDDQQILAVKTPADAEIPSPPSNVSVKPAGVNTVRLIWRPAIDNSTIREYIIFLNEDSIPTNSADTTFSINELITNRDYAFSVKAVDQAGNISQHSNVVHANTYLKGLYYEHSTGAWNDLQSIDWSVAEFSGMTNDFSLKEKTQEDFFNFKFDGFLSLEKEGVYQFRLTSDDGSLLSLNDSVWIENDGIHNINSVTSPVQLLQSGPHRITLKYFDYFLSDTLLVEYKGPDSNGEWVKIPPEALASSLITSAEEGTKPETFSFSIYPNPVTQNKIKIKLNSASSEPIVVKITDMAGRTFYHDYIPYASDLEIVPEVNIDNGIYMISVQQAKTRFIKRIVIRNF